MVSDVSHQDAVVLAHHYFIWGTMMLDAEVSLKNNMFHVILGKIEGF